MPCEALIYSKSLCVANISNYLPFFCSMGRKKMAPGLAKTGAQRSKEKREKKKRLDREKFLKDERDRKHESYHRLRDDMDDDQLGNLRAKVRVQVSIIIYTL